MMLLNSHAVQTSHNGMHVRGLGPARTLAASRADQALEVLWGPKVGVGAIQVDRPVAPPRGSCERSR